MLLNKKKLSDTEFEVMKVVWSNEPPSTTKLIMEQLGEKKKWKLPTVLSLMTRLVEKGFLRTEKIGKERTYYPIVDKEDYLKIETKFFMKNYHENSLSNLVDTFYQDREMSEKDCMEIISILLERRKRDVK